MAGFGVDIGQGCHPLNMDGGIFVVGPHGRPNCTRPSS